MTKAARRKRPVTRHPRPPKIPTRPKLKLNKPAAILILIAVLAAIPFCMGKYIEFGTPGAFDSGSNIYSAKHILEGARIGIEEKPSAGLGTLSVNILGVWIFGFSETGPKIIQALLQAAALILMFLTMRKLFGTPAAAVGVIIASVYLSAPLMAKAGNVKDQFAIAMMVLGVSCFVLQQLGYKWWLAVLAGAFLAWAPLFKETGYSAAGAVGLFVIAQPILRHGTWKRMGIDVGLLFAGAALSTAPLLIWLLTCHPNSRLPHYHAFNAVKAVFSSSQTSTEQVATEAGTDPNAVEQEPEKRAFWLKFLPEGYIRGSWMSLKPGDKSQMALRVMRYYWLLILPIALAIAAIVTRLIRMILRRTGKLRPESKKNYEKFVLLFAVWWLLDMIFVWGSPWSYEQYYLPLNASAAMLGGYLIAVYHNKARDAGYKPLWVVIGVLGLLAMIIMSWHIFFGIKKSPHSGTLYIDQGLPPIQRGYAQRLSEVHSRRKSGGKGAWEAVGEYIRENSEPSDGIYVWGWFPGIYVAAQRLSPAPKAFEGRMHTLSPQELSRRVNEILTAFEKQPPKFIVDSRKRHFPWDRPPLELWPSIQNGRLLVADPPADREELWYALLRTFDVQPDDLTREGFLRLDRTDAVRRYDAAFAKALRERMDPAEAQRYEAMKPFRQYVMKNYRIVRAFGMHVLFERK